MQEMLYPTSYIKSRRLGEKCALITDGRFSGGTSGLSIGHISPEAADHGELALIRDNDTIKIDIPKRKIQLLVSEEEIRQRTEEQNSNPEGWKPSRERYVSKALRAYASMVSSADLGGIRMVD